VFLGLKYGIRATLEHGGGSIINTGSVAGLVGFAGIPAYAASKDGVVQLTRTAAIEYATQGVRVNCLCPGVIDTPMVQRFTHGLPEAEEQMTLMEPVGRLGSAREVAELAMFLASDRSSFITGAVIRWMAVCRTLATIRIRDRVQARFLTLQQRGWRRGSWICS
jgi:NAD(P)-dependent dehydrogenase (short-subunit alcohol dehydrogenase family)